MRRPPKNLPEPTVSLKRARTRVNEPTARATIRYLVDVPTDLLSQNRLADEMIQWFLTKDTHSFNSFAIEKRMVPCRMYKISEVNPYFDGAIKFARYIIAHKLQEGWYHGTLDDKYAQRFLAIYDNEFRALVVDKMASNAERSLANNPPITVIIDRSPNDPSVPPRAN